MISLLVRSSAMSCERLAGSSLDLALADPAEGAAGGALGFGRRPAMAAPERWPGWRCFSSKTERIFSATSVAAAYWICTTRISLDEAGWSSRAMMRSSRCMFRPMSLTMIASGGKAMVSPSRETSCWMTARTGSAST